MDYTVQTVQKLGEGNEYGTPYTVKFAEEAETVFMLAKKAPVVGETEHGHITDEPTKKDPDKTYRRFKRAKEGFTAPQGSQEQPKQVDHDSMYRCNALNNAVAWCAAVKKGDNEDVTAVASQFYIWLKNENKGYESAKATAQALRPTEDKEDEPAPEFQGEKVFGETEEINLDDIPF